MEYEKGILKGVAAEILMMDGKVDARVSRFIQEYDKAVEQAIHNQIRDSQQPTVIKPFDLRDDNCEVGPS